MLSKFLQNGINEIRNTKGYIEATKRLVFWKYGIANYYGIQNAFCNFK